MEAKEWRLHADVMEFIWTRFGQAKVTLFVSQETSHCQLWFSLTHSSPAGCHGTDIAKAAPVCIYPDRSAPGISRESSPERHKLHSGRVKYGT